MRVWGKTKGTYEVNKGCRDEISTFKTFGMFTLVLIFSVVSSIVCSVIVYNTLAVDKDTRGVSQNSITKRRNDELRPTVSVVKPHDSVRETATPRHRATAFFADAPECKTSHGVQTLRYRRAIHQPVYDNSHETFKGIFSCPTRGIYIISLTLVRKRARSDSSPMSCQIHKTTANKSREQIAFIELHAKKPADNDTEIGSIAETRTVMVQLERGDCVYVETSNDPCTDMEHWTSFSGFLLFVN